MVKGDKVILHSYKHDESLHRVWKTEIVLDETEEVIVVANKKTRVVESNGRFWYTKEPSVSFFFKNHWFNVIGIIKNQDVSFYCNLSSPILYDDEAMKYIDYDLDIKVEKDGTYKILDMNEYKRNSSRMNYPAELQKIILLEMNQLKQRIENKEYPFTKKAVLGWYKYFKDLEGEL